MSVVALHAPAVHSGEVLSPEAVNEMDLFLRKMVLVLEEGGRGGYALILKKATTGSASMAMVSLSGAVAFQAADA
ncbi:unnamed protein product [Symbiodinium sp. CCMP2592]|nr:unnamed protein product [Symbiodinium sp. CCMP2592]